MLDDGRSCLTAAILTVCRRTAAPYCVPTACVCQHNSYCALTNTRGVRIGGAVFPDDVLGFLLEKLADVEYRLAHATNEQLQLSAMVGAFQCVRGKLVAAAV